MKLIGYGVIFGAIWLWIEQPLALAVAGGIVAGVLIGLGLPALFGPQQASGTVLEPVEADPVLDRLVGMGFRPEECRPLLIKARAAGNPDPAAYVMGSLIR